PARPFGAAGLGRWRGRRPGTPPRPRPPPAPLHPPPRPTDLTTTESPPGLPRRVPAPPRVGMADGDGHRIRHVVGGGVGLQAEETPHHVDHLALGGRS